MKSSDESFSSSEEEDTLDKQKYEIREDLKSLSFEEIMKLKEELGAKVYKEAVLGAGSTINVKMKKSVKDFKRLNKNRPREQSAKRQVPFMCAKIGTKNEHKQHTRDPRFDERAGEYDIKKFKENYKFVSEIREKEVSFLKGQLKEITTCEEEKVELKKTMQRLINKNVEDKKWHKKHQSLKEEQTQIQKAVQGGKQPHHMTKKERRTKELVEQFEELKQKGKLSKHLEKRRKKNAAKDRRRIGFD